MKFTVIAKIKQLFKRLINDFLYNYSLKKKLIVSFLLILLISNLFIGISTSYIAKSYLEKAEMRNHYNNISSLNNIIDFNYEAYIKKSETIFNNTILQDRLLALKDVKNIDDFMGIYNFVSDFLTSITNEFNYSYLKYTQSKYLFEDAKVTIYTNNNTFTSSGDVLKPYDLIKDSPWCRKVVDNNEMQWSIIDYGNSKKMIRFSRKLLNFKDPGFLGVLCIDIPISRIYSIINDNYNYPDSYIMYTDGSGSALTKKGEITAKLLDTLNSTKDIFKNNEGVKNIRYNYVDYIISYNTSPITGWKLISIMPMKYVTESSRKISVIIIITILMSALFCIMVSVINSNIISFRLKELISKIRKVEKDYYCEIADLKGNDEIGELDTAFNHSVGEIKRLIDVEYRSRIIRDSAKLELLQEQINPHLLYNTLSTIGWKAKSSGSKEIFDITNSLIRFYRTSLNRGNIVIKVQQEVDMTMEYIEIMEYTYNLNFIKDIDIDKRIYEFYTIKLILQPIVENAIVHGIRNIDYQGTLIIRGEYRQGNIIFSIKDNGMGMDEDTIERLMKSVDESEKGYGVSSVIRRLRLFFGEEYGLNIESTPGKGTSVEVKLPAFTENELKQYLTDKYLL